MAKVKLRQTCVQQLAAHIVGLHPQSVSQRLSLTEKVTSFFLQKKTKNWKCRKVHKIIYLIKNK